MKSEHNDNTEHHFDPCHSDDIPGGCSSCSHRDECIPNPSSSHDLRDFLDTEADDLWAAPLIVERPEQLQLFDVEELLGTSTKPTEDTNPFGESCVVTYDDEGEPEILPLAPYLEDLTEFVTHQVIQQLVSTLTVLLPSKDDPVVAFIDGIIHVGNMSQISTLMEASDVMSEAAKDLGEKW